MFTTQHKSDEQESSGTFHSDEEVLLATNCPKKRAGRKVFKETRHPIYRGVRSRNNDKWVCELRDPNNNNNRIWLGTYSTPEMAARAHDLAALALKGKSACLNFADSAWRLQVPDSKDAKVLRKAAKEAAEAFRFDGYSEEGQASCRFMDEEAVFDFHGLVADMAEGMLLPPPPYDNSCNWVDEDCQHDLSLWNF